MKQVADLRGAFDGARVLITGGNGFIAGHLLEALLELGASVMLVDTEAPPVERIKPRVQFAIATVGELPFRLLLRSTGPYDYIFHLAARAYAAGSVGAPQDDFQINLAATFDLLEELRQQQAASRLLFASSAAVYGNPVTFPMHEDSPLAPVSPYGVSKLAAERYVAVYAQLYGIRAASLRLFSVYGPGQRKQVVYDLFAKLQQNPKALVVLGDGTQVRDLLYVADAVRAFLVVAAEGREDGFAYNVAAGQGTSMAELAQWIIDVEASQAEVVFTGATRPGDPERWVGSCEPLMRLGGAPQVSLQQGLRETAAWFHQHWSLHREVHA